MKGKYERKKAPPSRRTALNLFICLLLVIIGVVIALFTLAASKESNEKDNSTSNPALVETHTEPEPTIDERDETFKKAEQLFIDQKYAEASDLLVTLGTYKNAGVLLDTSREREIEASLEQWRSSVDFYWPDDYSFAATYKNDTRYQFDVTFTIQYQSFGSPGETFTAKDLKPNESILVDVYFPYDKLGEEEFSYWILWELSDIRFPKKTSTVVAGGNAPASKNESQSQNQSTPSRNTFTNKYGTATTICAHSGCYNYIASSGDTNCCTSHSNKCIDCNKYIDEDAYWCVSCIAKAASPTCLECGKSASYSIKGISGQTEYYCKSCYSEILELLEWLENN